MKPKLKTLHNFFYIPLQDCLGKVFSSKARLPYPYFCAKINYMSACVCMSIGKFSNGHAQTCKLLCSNFNPPLV